jgi:DNA-binding response OmpR family regulator
VSSRFGYPDAPSTVLLLGTDGPLRTATRRLLEARGFTVVLHRYGVEPEPGDVDLAIVDLRPAGETASQLAERVETICGTVPVLCLANDREPPPDGFPCLTKPFGPDDLDGRVRALLTAA